MAYTSIAQLPPSDRAMRGKAAIVGLGETDYHSDYKAQRAKPPGYEPPSFEGLAAQAFERALSDAGLTRDDIDGLAVSGTFGAPEPDDLAHHLGLAPRYCISNGNIMAGPLPVVCADIASGKADCVAMVFAIAPRTIGRQFGGVTDRMGGATPASYYYYHPWGWSSQAAHWALVFSHYRAAFGVSEEDLAEVAMQLRRHAIMTPQAVMQQPMSLADYMACRYIVRPLRLFDICMVNDGAVCLIVRRADMAGGMTHRPVLVAGWSEAKVAHSKLDTLVRQRLAPQLQAARDEAMAMAGVSLSDVGHFEGYDPGSIHLISQVEGYGFTPPGTGLAFCREGQMTLGGRIPTNMGGGNISGAYMQGWSQVAEAVRQLRHEAGPRQVEGLEVSMTSLAQTDRIHPLILRRG